MRFGIPLLGQRVAPRCTIADELLLVTVKRRRLMEQSVLRLDGPTWMDLTRVLTDEQVGTLVCGGISRSSRESIESRQVDVIDNVAGTADEVVAALLEGGLRSGFGIAPPEDAGTVLGGEPPGGGGRGTETVGGAGAVDKGDGWEMGESLDCLACADRACLGAVACPHISSCLLIKGREHERTIEAARDVACEDERTLCRLAELVYFALEMGYMKLGVAFCTDLHEPASVLTGVLRRFFQVVPVCCKVRGIPEEGPSLAQGRRSREPSARPVAVCDPLGQAAVLNAAGTDLNVLVGLCVGVDGVLSRESCAPTTTIFVKDKSLANNPVGAVYSHYHLEGI